MFFCDVCVRVLLLQPESQLAGSFGRDLNTERGFRAGLYNAKGIQFQFSHQYQDLQTNHLDETWAKEEAMPISVQNDHLQENLLASLHNLPFLC